MFGWRDDDLVLVIFAGGLAGDLLPEVFTTARAIAGRVPGSEPASTPSRPDELRTGGLWEVQPTYDDVPEGFVLLRDRDFREELEASPVP